MGKVREVNRVDADVGTDVDHNTIRTNKICALRYRVPLELTRDQKFQADVSCRVKVKLLAHDLLRRFQSELC